MPNETHPTAHYLFIVARDRPDIVDRVKERLRADLRIDVIMDRRHGERRRCVVPQVPDRRHADRRRPTRHWDDLSVYPTLVVQKRLESYAELRQRAAAAARDCEQLREDNGRLQAEIANLRAQLAGRAAPDEDLRVENARLRDAVASLETRLNALVAADTAFKEETAAIVGQAEQTVGALIATFQTLTHGRPFGLK